MNIENEVPEPTEERIHDWQNDDGTRPGHHDPDTGHNEKKLISEGIYLVPGDISPERAQRLHLVGMKICPGCGVPIPNESDCYRCEPVKLITVIP